MMTYEPTEQDLEEMEIVYAIRDIRNGADILEKKLIELQEKQDAN